MIPAISFALALFLSTALVPVGIRYASALGLVDEPDEKRKFHSEPVPRVGGVAIVLAFFLPVLVWMNNIGGLSAFLIGAGIIAVFGFLDDRHNLNYQWKFFGQIIAVAVFVVGNLEITKTPFLGLGDVVPWLSYPVVALFLLGVTNAVNLSDGLDGLAAGSSLLSLGFLAFLSYGAADYAYTIIAVAAMGGLTGFLRFNTHPASVFMGDTGSQFLGYVAGCLALMVTQSENLAVSPVLPLLILGLPILDTLMVIALRLRDGVSPFKPDRRHLHHQFLATGMQHYQAVAAIYVLNFILLFLAYLVRYADDFAVFETYLLFAAISLGALMFIKHSPVVQRRRQRLVENKERRNLWLRKMQWLHTYGASLIQVLLGSVWVLYILVGMGYESWLLFPVILALALGAVHWRFFRFENRLVARIIFYTASVLVVFSLSSGSIVELPSWRSLNILDLSLALLVVLLALVIRTTRKEHFKLDTQDILVLLVLLSAPILNFGEISQNDMVGGIVRLAILLYAAEFVVSRLQRPAVASCCAAVTLAIYVGKIFL